MIVIKIKQHLDLNTGKINWTWKYKSWHSWEHNLTLTQCMEDALFRLNVLGWFDDPEMQYKFKMNHYVKVGRVYKGKHRRV